jgi:HlyD family secretion protein
MSSDNNQLTPEKLKQLQQLQQMIAMSQKAGGGAKTSKLNFSIKGVITAIFVGMQGGVKFIDKFIKFIIKDDTDTNDVLKTARAPIVFGFYTILIFVVFGSLWAATAPLDSAAVAPGTVMSDSKKKSLNHQEGGIIKAIYVKLGDHVKKDQPLIELDDTRLRSDYESTLNQYRSSLATEARLIAETSDLESIEFPEFLTNSRSIDSVSRIIETQISLFQSKKALIQAETDSLKQRINQSNKTIEGLEARKVSSEKTLEFLQDRVAATRKLTAKGFAQKASLLEMEAKEASAKSEIAMNDTDIAKQHQEIIRMNIELMNVGSKFLTESLRELKEIQINVSATRERYTQLSDALSRIIIKSPVDGIINQINFYTVGSHIPPSQPILEISPADDSLIIEAKIDPKNIDSIRVGLLSKIRFSAFKSRTTPLFTGKVISLSPDIVIDPRGSMDPKLGGGYYVAQIELDMDEFKNAAGPRKLELHPGMQAEVQIITGTRTLLRYLLDPVFDAMFKGFKEK